MRTWHLEWRQGRQRRQLVTMIDGGTPGTREILLHNQ